ncbi:MAG: RNA polymerase sigma factor [Myxococcota bacterium]
MNRAARDISGTFHDSSDDVTLVEGIRRGDHVAATQFYRRYRPQIDQLVYRMLGPDREHEDLVQQALFLIWKRIDQLRDPTRVQGWVRSITVNAVRGHLRRRRIRRRHIATVENVEEAIVFDPDPDARDLLRAVYAVLDRMSARHRVVFVLRYVEAYSLTEVAESCSVSLATAKRRLKSARDRFRALAFQEPRLLELVSSSTKWDGEA